MTTQQSNALTIQSSSVPLDSSNNNNNNKESIACAVAAVNSTMAAHNFFQAHLKAVLEAPFVAGENFFFSDGESDDDDHSQSTCDEDNGNDFYSNFFRSDVANSLYRLQQHPTMTSSLTTSSSFSSYLRQQQKQQQQNHRFTVCGIPAFQGVSTRRKWVQPHFYAPPGDCCDADKLTLGQRQNAWRLEEWDKLYATTADRM